MTIERRNPLPAGTYWIDVFAPKLADWTAWTTLNRGKVKVTTSEHFDANAGGPARDFQAFTVLTPTPFPNVQLGYPTIASGPNITSDDTVQKPPPPKDFLDTIDPAGDFAMAKALLGVGALTLLGVGIAYIATSARR
jgi:hypothetical protein